MKSKNWNMSSRADRHSYHAVKKMAVFRDPIRKKGAICRPSGLNVDLSDLPDIPQPFSDHRSARRHGIRPMPVMILA